MPARSGNGPDNLLFDKYLKSMKLGKFCLHEDIQCQRNANKKKDV